ncbi:uncharacterized protein LOC128216098 [Mya arenaria]|uniref:uncharacterized protein LOC128216098 n=1 Tax=Mya arenaria TaxID=6604 RepID=UPI0022E86FC5|nr:uncharacterized protein LOC128216098 [Mya arenaria]
MEDILDMVDMHSATRLPSLPGGQAPDLHGYERRKNNGFKFLPGKLYRQTDRAINQGSIFQAGRYGRLSAAECDDHQSRDYWFPEAMRRGMSQSFCVWFFLVEPRLQSVFVVRRKPLEHSRARPDRREVLREV